MTSLVDDLSVVEWIGGIDSDGEITITPYVKVGENKIEGASAIYPITVSFH